MVTTSIFAERVQIGELYYNLDEYNHTAELTYRSREADNAYNADWNITYICIPESVVYRGTSYVVNSIGEWAFWGCTKVTSVKIPNTVTIIKQRAFQKCTSLTHIALPKSLTQIEQCAFCWCESLTSISIPNGIKIISGSLFSGCKKLKTIIIPNSVTEIGGGAFYGCSSLASIEIPNSVTSIGGSAFSHCENLTSVSMGNNVQTIGVAAFSDCYNLPSIILPNSLTHIERLAFITCKNLSSIILPKNVVSVGDAAFDHCGSLKELTYPAGLNISKSKYPSTTKLIAYNRKYPPYQPVKQTEAQHIASSNSRSTSTTVTTTTSQLPPLLSLVDGSLIYHDVSGNNRLDANENNRIKFKVNNLGKGAAYNCEARVKLSGSTSGIKVQSVKLPTIAVGQTYEVNIPITSDICTQDGKVTFSLEVYEPNGWGVAPFDLTVVTKAYEAPYLKVVDYNITSNSGKIKKMEPFTVSFNLQNVKYGDAEQVKVKVNIPDNVFIMDGFAEQSFAQIKSGETKTIQLTLAANNNYPINEIPITIDVKERYGKFAENRNLSIALNAVSSGGITIAAKDEPKVKREEIKLSMLSSEVDRNIPTTTTQNKNTFAVIIANENYQQVASVPFALNDGKVFRQYCEQTLGIPAKNIREQTNATGNQIKAIINWLYTVVEVFDNPNIIFYYAGHGIPDEKSKTAYLLPVDGILSDLSTCYKLDDLYTTLGEMPVGRISVFMDACFSGSKREQGMLASARGVALKARPGQPQGNMVVFSAAQGDETAYPYSSKQHGMFTYYLLKKLQDTQGDVTLQELGNYITSNVKQQSVLENDKIQTPTITPSNTVSDEWKSWKLK